MHSNRWLQHVFTEDKPIQSDGRPEPGKQAIKHQLIDRTLLESAEGVIQYRISSCLLLLDFI